MAVPLARVAEFCPAATDVEAVVLLEACAPDLFACTDAPLLADVAACAPDWACAATVAAKNALLRITTLVTFIVDCLLPANKNPKQTSELGCLYFPTASDTRGSV